MLAVWGWGWDRSSNRSCQLIATSAASHVWSPFKSMMRSCESEGGLRGERGGGERGGGERGRRKRIRMKGTGGGRIGW